MNRAAHQSTHAGQRVTHRNCGMNQHLADQSIRPGTTQAFADVPSSLHLRGKTSVHIALIFDRCSELLSNLRMLRVIFELIDQGLVVNIRRFCENCKIRQALTSRHKTWQSNVAKKLATVRPKMRQLFFLQLLHRQSQSPSCLRILFDLILECNLAYNKPPRIYIVPGNI